MRAPGSETIHRNIPERMLRNQSADSTLRRPVPQATMPVAYASCQSPAQSV